MIKEDAPDSPACLSAEVAPHPICQVVLGVTGGIAAYKAAEVVRRLRQQDLAVQVVMTESAMSFVHPLTFQALSGRPVRHALLDESAEAGMGHIELARWAHQVVVAPASADFMARLAGGHANDLLTTLCLATEAPLVLCPAMNRVMWRNEATQANRRLLEGRGVHVVGPDSGAQACGETGEGRMVSTEEIAHAATARYNNVLAGCTVLITAGPTREAIDPVRYITNRSSGKMGYALARAALEAGAEVTLISGPSRLEPPWGVQLVAVESAGEMHDAVMDHVPRCQVFIGAAAVADYTPAQAALHKVKKSSQEWLLSLQRTTDIIGSLGARRAAGLPGPFLVGFAAETQNLEAHALDKLQRKHLDLLIANPVNQRGLGFDSNDNEAHCFWPGGTCSFPRQDKQELARRLIALLAQRHQASRHGQAAASASAPVS